MVSVTNTVSFQGLTALNISVQVHISSGLPCFNIVGLPDKAIAESKERIRAAFGSIAISLPASRITVNLAPASIVKEGSHYDLPIALAILEEMNVIEKEELYNYVVLGELSLDGSITSVSGVLPSAIHALNENKGIICPFDNAAEILYCRKEIDILAAKNLIEIVNHFKGTQLLRKPEKSFEPKNEEKLVDMQDIYGQETAKRAIEIAASGGHNLLMVGPPGAGKSMLASAILGIIPEMSFEEMLHVAMIASIASSGGCDNLTGGRPYRSPHHSCSLPAMVGGGRNANPGEVTLAHNGILFMDELPEFSSNVIDSLRQPIESGSITVSRVNYHVTYPAKFQLIVAMNPCKCGYINCKTRGCGRAPQCAAKYRSKISGPVLDRIDLQVVVPALTPREVAWKEKGESSDKILSRVTKVRKIQEVRYKDTDITKNSEANGEFLYQVSKPDKDAIAILNDAYEKMNLSMRGYNRVLRVARTIADIEYSDCVSRNHIAEALNYRNVKWY